MNPDYELLKSELDSELNNILEYWKNNTLDYEFGGFVGKIDHNNKIVKEATKGIILNTRILWSFSAASNHIKTKQYQQICDRAFIYLKSFFKDQIHEGVFWELDYKGKPINKRKQVYAQAFTIYALSEYYVFTENEEAKNWAISLFKLLENCARDRKNMGYFEAFDEDWSPIKDMRLSTKDMNASKTMNTHLHILEAYTSLFKIHNTPELREALTTLVKLFLNTFLNDQNHYELFFDDSWSLMSNSISYGHDIETAWLVIDAAQILQNKPLLEKVSDIAVKVANTFLKEAISNDGAVLNEKDRTTNHIDTDRHWWPQVEALIGLKYVHELDKKSTYINASLRIWEYIKKNLIDYKHGEWFFRVNADGIPYKEEDKVSMWKAPYHTTRACILLNKNRDEKI